MEHPLVAATVVFARLPLGNKVLLLPSKAVRKGPLLQSKALLLLVKLLLQKEGLPLASPTKVGRKLQRRAPSLMRRLRGEVLPVVGPFLLPKDLRVAPHLRVATMVFPRPIPRPHLPKLLCYRTAIRPRANSEPLRPWLRRPHLLKLL